MFIVDYHYTIIKILVINCLKYSDKLLKYDHDQSRICFSILDSYIQSFNSQWFFSSQKYFSPEIVWTYSIGSLSRLLSMRWRLSREDHWMVNVLLSSKMADDSSWGRFVTSRGLHVNWYRGTSMKREQQQHLNQTMKKLPINHHNWNFNSYIGKHSINRLLYFTIVYFLALKIWMKWMNLEFMW